MLNVVRELILGMVKLVKKNVTLSIDEALLVEFREKLPYSLSRWFERCMRNELVRLAKFV